MAAAGEADVRTLFEQIPAAREWRLVKQIPLEFDAFHPQGMVIVGDAMFFSSVEVT